jgi:hypothetical protein
MTHLIQEKRKDNYHEHTGYTANLHYYLEH